MAGTAVDICNLALGHLRQSPVQDVNERSPEARDCKQFYDTAIEAALRSHDWNFARTFTAGVALAGALKPGWAYKFVLPPDCIYLRDIARADRRQERHRFEVTRDATGGTDALVVHCNTPAPIFIYTTRDVPTSAYDPAFVAAASYHLASMLAMPRTGKVALVDAMRKLAVQAAAEARTESANEETNDVNEDHDPDWVRARGGLRSYGRFGDKWYSP